MSRIENVSKELVFETFRIIVLLFSNIRITTWYVFTAAAPNFGTEADIALTSASDLVQRNARPQRSTTLKPMT